MNNKLGFWIMNSKKSGEYYIYVLRCCDDKFYVGLTQYLVQRTYQHIVGEGAKFTKQHLPCGLVHLSFANNYKHAATIEAELTRFVNAGWRSFVLPFEYSELFYRIYAMCSGKDLMAPPEGSYSAYDNCRSMIDVPPFPALCVTRNLD